MVFREMLVVVGGGGGCGSGGVGVVVVVVVMMVVGVQRARFSGGKLAHGSKAF